jgi:Tol biopolymer transport system component/DNA-binding winged helix-turn-helix (wHTH) protein
MQGISEPRPSFHFGIFELDVQSGELRKHGIKIKLQDQPLQILTLLIENAGEVVTREQIKEQLWTGDTFVDFDNAINSAVRKMRDALGDASESPRFVETLARKGYRFIAPVSQHGRSLVPQLEPAQPVRSPVTLVRSTRHYWFTAVVAAASLIIGAALVYWLKRDYVEPHAIETLTYSGRDSSPAVSPDGKTVVFTSDRDGTSRIWLKQLKGGGEIALTSGPDGWPRYSPDGATILFSRREGGRRSLFKVASVGGEPRKLIDDALDGDFSPDGRRIAFVRWKYDEQRQKSIIAVANADGSSVSQLAEVPNVRLEWPRWSPDGSAIAVVGAGSTVAAEIFVEVWIASLDGKQPRRLNGSGRERGISSVVWTGKRTIAYARGDRTTPVSGELIVHDTMTDQARRIPWLCCSLTFDIAGPGRLIFDQQAIRSGLLELGRDGRSARWISHANSPDRQPVFSPDGKHVAFASNRDGNMNLWQISLDTGAIRRLTESRATDYDPGFSPDGKRLIFSSDRTGHFEIYMANPDGSAATQVTHDGVDAENATMTADLQWLVYASANPQKAGIWKIHPDGSQATRLVSGIGNNPEVSPDGTYALYIANPHPDLAEIHVVRISDGAEIPRPILCPRWKQNGMTLGRARWIPAGGSAPPAIAFIGQDASGATGVYIQDFVPGRNTSAGRRMLRPFDPIAPVESLGVSPDGKRVVVSVADDTNSIMSASNVDGINRRN